MTDDAEDLILFECESDYSVVHTQQILRLFVQKWTVTASAQAWGPVHYVEIDAPKSLLHVDPTKPLVRRPALIEALRALADKLEEEK